MMESKLTFHEVPLGFPLPALRRFMVPDQTVSFKTFQAANVIELDVQVNLWVEQTKNIIAVVGSVSRLDADVVLSLTFVAAVVGGMHGKV